LPDPVVAACEANYPVNIADCNAFACAVAAAVGVTLSGNANAMTDILRAGADGWTVLADGPADAADGNALSAV
jgi:hypothetical protein